VAHLLDSLMPAWDQRSAQRLTIAAPEEEVWSALHQVTLREMPIFRALLTLRQPFLPLARRERRLGAGSDRPLLAEMVSGAFVPLAQRPTCEVVIGLIARPWLPNGGLGRVDRAEFMAMEEPGWVKIVLGFRLDQVGPATLLLTETRVRATDAAARRRFWIYWLAIGWGSAVTRRAWLRAIKRRAEAESSPGR
jgi:hypothetical protein